MKAKELTDTKAMLTGIANSFWIQHKSIGKSSMVVQVPADMKKAIVAKLKREGREAFANFSVPIFGPHHARFLKLVVAPRAAINTFYDSATTTFAPTGNGVGNRRGPCLIPVERYMDITTKSDALVKAADEHMDDFMGDYETMIEDGIHAANDTFAGFGLGDYFRSNGKIPTAREFRARFYIDIPEPEPLAVFDLERYKNASIPVAKMNRIAASNLSALAAKMDGAKTEAINNAREVAEKVADQLSALAGGSRKNSKGDEYKGARLSPSLISKAKQAAQILDDLNQGFDFDPQLKTVADVMRDKIANVDSTEVWKTSPSAAAESLRAAKAATKVMDAAVKSKKTGNKAASKTIQPTDEILGGSMFD